MQTTTHDFVLAQEATDAFPILGTGAAYGMSWICQSTTSGPTAAPAFLANPAEEINQNKFNKALQSNCFLIYQSQVSMVK